MMHTMAPPTPHETYTALRIVGRELGTSHAFERGGVCYFDVGEGWMLGLSADDAARFRVSAFYGATEVARLWSLAVDRERLAALARELRTEVAALVA